MTPPSTEGLASAAEARAGERTARMLPWVLPTLVLATALSAIDRQVLGLLLEPIRREFALTDTQLGILSGPAFTVLYAVMALPFAVLSDRVSRRLVIALALGTFSVMTAFCAMAPGFIYLLMFRMGVAVGEAAVVPASQAQVADIYPKGRLTDAMSKLYVSGSIGGILAFLIGGFLSGWLGWRLTFLIIGLPGLLLAVLAYVVLPGRATAARTPSGAILKGPALWRSIRFLWSQRTYRYLTFANGFWSFTGAGLALWAAPYIARTYKLPPAQIGIIMAVVVGLSGAAGLFVLGGLAQRLARKDIRWTIWVPAAAALVALPMALLTFLTSMGEIALVAGCLITFFASSTQGPVASAVQLVAPGSMRSVAVAVKHLVVTAVGAGTGPLVVGMLNDAMAKELGEAAIRYSLTLISLFYVVAAVLFLMASKTFPEDIARAEGWRNTSGDEPAV